MEINENVKIYLRPPDPLKVSRYSNLLAFIHLFVPFFLAGTQAKITLFLRYLSSPLGQKYFSNPQVSK